MEIIRTNIEGVVIVEPRLFKDERGYFFESFNELAFCEKVCKVRFVRDNESASVYGVLRGLHFQKPPFAQAKLVRVVAGEVLDVAVDIRRDSPTYGQYASCLLSAENHRQFFLPRGMAHGFVVLSQKAIFQYKCDEYYHPEAEGGVAWNDPDIAIEWGIAPEKIILSEKDKKNSILKDLPPIF